MTLFSTLLSEHIKSKNIRTYPLAQYCGIDRSNMYKLISGKRNPSSESIVNRIADFMKLTPIERKDLLESYKISVIGYDTYYRRKNVQEFISDFSDKRKVFPDISSYFTATFDTIATSDSVLFSGNTDINRAIYSILSMEAQKPKGHIRLILQPDSVYFTEILSYIVRNKCDLKIEHIICLNNSDNITIENRDYNLTCLQQIIPMYSISRCEYMPFYYYDSILSHNNVFNLLSSLIVTSECVLTFSSTLQYGILFTQKQFIEHFTAIFDNLKEDTTPVVCKIDSVFTQLSYFDNFTLGKEVGYSFQKEPCMIPLMPLSFPEKYLSRDLPNRKDFLESVTQYISKKADLFKSLTTQFAFTEKGVQNFFHTGRIFELPSSVYRPVELNDRILMIRNLINACKNQNYRMMHPDAPIASSNLCIYVTSRSGYMLFSTVDGELVYLELEEPSLLMAFYDYLGSMEDPYFYTTEEAVSILKDLIKGTTRYQ